MHPELSQSINWTEPCARPRDHITNVELNAMDPTTNPPNLPSVLSKLLQPWLDVVEVAAADNGLNVMKVAAEVVVSLPRLVVMTPDLEYVIAEARLASDNLGISLNQDGTDPSKLRIEAMKGLDALIMQLREAKLNDQAKGLA